MNPIRKSLALAALSVPVLLTGQAHAVVVALDTFENGVNVGETSTKGNDAFDPTDLAWFSALDFGVASLQNDIFAGGGSQKALQLASPDTFRRVGAAFASTTLGANTGDKIVLSFDMRLAETPTANQVGFRFGLYNSAGTSIVSDNPQGTTQPTAQNDDFGYVVKISTGAPATLENSITDEPAGDNPTGGTTVGTVIGNAASPVTINDQLKHSFSLTLERAGASLINLSFIADGILKTTAVDATPFLTFDTIYFAQGNLSTDFRIDNVRVETILAAVNAAIPEPATLSLAAIGMAALLRRRHVRA